MEVHTINVAIWGHTDPSDVSIDTANSTEIRAVITSGKNKHSPIVDLIIMSFYMWQHR